MTFPKKISISDSTKKIKPLLPPKLITFDAYNTLYGSTIPVVEQCTNVNAKYSIFEVSNALVKRFPKCLKSSYY